MFVLVILEDKVKITPELFDKDNTDMILAEIDQKFINKVSHDTWYLFTYHQYGYHISCHPVIIF